MTPGKMIAPIVEIVAETDPKKVAFEKTFPHPSKMRLQVASVMPMMGASQNNVATGFVIPIDSFSRRICTSDQRSPPRADAVRTAIIPPRSNCVSDETMRTTPAVMMNIIPTSLHEGTSSRKRKANPRTKMRPDDLHIALRRGGGLDYFVR